MEPCEPLSPLPPRPPRPAQMRYPRWYPTATLLPSGNVVIMGGTQVSGGAVGEFGETAIQQPLRTLPGEGKSCYGKSGRLWHALD